MEGLSLRGSKDSTSLLQARTHGIFFDKHAKLLTLQNPGCHLEDPMIRLQF